MTKWQHDGSQDALMEVRRVSDTARRVADGGTTEGADDVRVLAGLIHQLAEQVERLATPPRPPLEGIEA